MPVVPGPGDGEHELRIGKEREPHTGKTDCGRKVQRCVHTVDVHVADPGVDVPHAGTQLLEPRRLEELLLDGSPGDGIDRDLRQDGAVEQPRVVALGRLDHAWRPVDEPPRHPPLEQVRWFHQMVVDRDQRMETGATFGRCVGSGRHLSDRHALDVEQPVHVRDVLRHYVVCSRVADGRCTGECSKPPQF